MTELHSFLYSVTIPLGNHSVAQVVCIAIVGKLAITILQCLNLFNFSVISMLGGRHFFYVINLTSKF